MITLLDGGDPDLPDALEGYLGTTRAAPADRPWVMANMVASVDGAITLDGVSGGLSDPADRAVFHALRGLADVVMAGAATVRTEGYGPARPSPQVRAARRAAGRPETPAVAVVTASLELDWGAPLFIEAETPTIVIAPSQADAGRLRDAERSGRLVTTPGPHVSLPEALATLGRTGTRVLLCEGGPRLLGQLATLGLLDELFLTLAPRLVGGRGTGLLDATSLGASRPLRLRAVARHADHMFLRYLAAAPD